MQIIEGVYQLVTPFPKVSYAEAKEYRSDLGRKPRWIKSLPYVLPYLVRSGSDTALIDNGWNTDAAYDALCDGMAEHGARPRDLRQLIVTHVHPDHFGLTGRLADESGGRVLMHEKEAEVIQSRYLQPQPLINQMEGWMERHGVPRLTAPDMARGSMGMLDKVSARQPDVSLVGGERLKVGDFELEVIWTPGHAPGHICLYEPNRKLLMSGDHVLPTITPNVSRHAQTSGNPLSDYIKSLDTVAALDVEILLPAHEFDTRDLKGRIAEIRHHHDERLAEMERCVGDGATAWEVASRVRWTTGMLADFEPFMQRSAVGETLAHLEYLQELGRLEMHDSGEEGGVITWTRT
ncbi:MAG TPA: MBL fold metallo-hydrolase [Dehalococcoidia bacterium]|nr:MBL fold metallo-hydrolase [Dehalococcoidia bacterium]